MFCVQNKGLSSNQASGGEAFDWVKNLMQGGAVLELPKNYQVQQQHEQQQQKQQQLEPLKCPRCESTNTKFCYYNNYNRSQPRHFCKSCRRHWTKGGTLRNVPVGGGRKSKRPKTSTCSSSGCSTTSTTTSMISNSTTTTTITANNNCHMIDRGSSVQQNLALALGHDQKSVPQILYKALLQPTSIKPDYTHGNDDELSSSNTIGGWPPLSLDNLLPPPTVSTLNSSSYTSSMPSFSGCFESIITQNYTNQTGLPEYPSMLPKPWPSLPITSDFDSSSCCWNWEDLNSFISITDQRQPWDVPN